MTPVEESALVVLVPAAETVVKPFRDRYDPAAIAGVPAHVTLLYPFKAPGEIDQPVIGKLGACFARSTPFRFSLHAIRRFRAEVLYLAPEPDQAFRQLTLELWRLFPDTPPYAGKWPDIIPHLSVALARDDAVLDAISDDFTRAAQGRLPIHAIASEVALMETRRRRWQVRTVFRLGLSAGGLEPKAGS